MARAATRQRAQAGSKQAKPRTPAPGKKLTYEEFLDWCGEDSWAEWVDGEVIILSPASLRHQQIAGFLYFLLELFVKTFDLGQVLNAPIQMRLGTVRSGR